MAKCSILAALLLPFTTGSELSDLCGAVLERVGMERWEGMRAEEAGGMSRREE